MALRCPMLAATYASTRNSEFSPPKPAYCFSLLVDAGLRRVEEEGREEVWGKESTNMGDELSSMLLLLSVFVAAVCAVGVKVCVCCVWFLCCGCCSCNCCCAVSVGFIVVAVAVAVDVNVVGVAVAVAMSAGGIPGREIDDLRTALKSGDCSGCGDSASEKDMLSPPGSTRCFCSVRRRWFSAARSMVQSTSSVFVVVVVVVVVEEVEGVEESESEVAEGWSAGVVSERARLSSETPPRPTLSAVSEAEAAFVGAARYISLKLDGTRTSSTTVLTSRTCWAESWVWPS